MIKRVYNYKRNYSITISLLFVFGALMTLLYLPLIEKRMPDREGTIPLLLATTLFVSSVLASSINGVLLLPCNDVIFGALCALEADALRTNFNGNVKDCVELLVFLVMVPLHFIVCEWGMHSGAAIRDALGEKQEHLEKDVLVAYLIMFSGTALLVAVQCMLFI